MRVAVVLKDASDWTASAFLRNLKKRGVSAEPLEIAEVSALIPHADEISHSPFLHELTKYDSFLVRDIGGVSPKTSSKTEISETLKASEKSEVSNASEISEANARSAAELEEISFKFDILRALSSHKIVMNSPDAIQNAANKFYSSLLFASAKLPVPRTIVTSSVEVALRAVEKFGSAIIKPIFGHQGIGIERIDSSDASYRMKIQRIIAERGVIYMQEFIPNAGRDIRVFVVGDEVVGAIYRISPEGSVVSNLSAGGKAVRCEPSEEICEIALKATRAIGADFAGVDLIERITDGKIFLLEINGTPSARGIKIACDVDATEKIVDLLISRLKRG